MDSSSYDSDAETILDGTDDEDESLEEHKQEVITEREIVVVQDEDRRNDQGGTAFADQESEKEQANAVRTSLGEVKTYANRLAEATREFLQGFALAPAKSIAIEELIGSLEILDGLLGDREIETVLESCWVPMSIVLVFAASLLGMHGDGIVLPCSTIPTDELYQVQNQGSSIKILMAEVRKVEERRGRRVCWGCKSGWKVEELYGWIAIATSKVWGLIDCLNILRIMPVNHDDFISRRATRKPGTNKGFETVHTPYDRIKAEIHLNSFLSYVLWANATVDKGFAYKHAAMRGSCYFFAGLYYLVHMKKAVHRGQVCYAGKSDAIAGKLPFARFVWNLPERPMVKVFYTLGLPRIRHDRVFTVPLLDNPGQVVQGRIISQVKLGWLPRKRDHKKPGKDETSHEAIVLHMHGGGFISMSSFSHENYTRHWAHTLRVPIVSCDYRLAPENPFPAALDDAYSMYRWCVDVGLVKYNATKVILVGDSAGGNLCAAITVRAIEEGYRIPDGLLLCYPAVDLRRSFTPSMLWTMNDRIVPYIFLQCCMSAYIGDPEKIEATTHNPKVSPICASDEVLSRFPRTHIVVGDKDPLYDIAVKFAYRLETVFEDASDVSLTVYPGMIHGFLSFGWPLVGVNEVSQCVRHCGMLLQDLIDHGKSPAEDVGLT